MLLGKYLLGQLLNSSNNRITGDMGKLILILSMSIPLLSSLLTILMWVVINAFGTFLIEAGFSNNMALTLEITFLILSITVMILYVKKHFGLVLGRNNPLAPNPNTGLLLNCFKEFIRGYNQSS